MTDNLDALRAKVVAADAQYLDYEDASLPQERAHYPAVDLIDAQAELITALEAALTASEQARAQAVSALKPFALTDDERLELGAFLDDEDVYMRPDDGNDSVKNGWRKQVTIGNLRHARNVLRDAAPNAEAESF